MDTKFLEPCCVFLTGRRRPLFSKYRDNEEYFLIFETLLAMILKKMLQQKLV